MNLPGSGIPQQFYDTAHCVAPDNGVIYQDDTPAFNALPNGSQFYPHTVKPFPLPRRNKCSPDVLVLYQPDPVRYAGFLAKTKRRVKAGVRRANDNVRFYGMCLCKYFPCLYPGGMNGNAVDNRIRAGKIYIFKNAELFILFPTMFTP